MQGSCINCNFLVVVRSGPASDMKADCCGCFQRKKRASIALSDIYCRTCSSSENCAQRAPLGPPDQNQCSCGSPNKINNLLNQSEYEFGKEKRKTKPKKKIKETRNNAAEFEFADDAISLNNENFDENPSNRTSVGSLKDTPFTENPYINVNGKEELPCVQEMGKYTVLNNVDTNEIHKTEPKIIISNGEIGTDDNNHRNDKFNASFDGNYNKVCVSKIYSYCTLPKRKNCNNHKTKPVSPPKRVTPDGTHIYYWCDLPKKIKIGKNNKYFYF